LQRAGGTLKYIGTSLKRFYDTLGGIGIAGLVISITAFCLLTFGFSSVKCMFPHISDPEKIRLLGGAITPGLVLVGLGLNAKRTRQYEKQLETQEKGLYAERLKSAITLLSDRAVSIQLGAVSLLQMLAQEVPGTKEEKRKNARKYRRYYAPSSEPQRIRSDIKKDMNKNPRISSVKFWIQ